MAFYLNKREFFNGALTLYQRNLEVANPTQKTHKAPKWYYKVKLEGAKAATINKSTKLSSYEAAYAYAEQEYQRLFNAHRLGKTLEDWTFEQHWEDWYKRNLQKGVWQDKRAKWHAGYFKLYFSKYFVRHGKSIALNDIDYVFANAYFDWRLNFWHDDANQKLITYNPKRRDAKTKSTGNHAKTPAQKTLQMEQSALNQILFDAFERGRTQQVFKFKAPKLKRTSGSQSDSKARRPFFQDAEYTSLTRNLRSYRDCVGIFKPVRINESHKRQRIQLYHFILFLSNSGLRVGEAREMRWMDCKLDVEGGWEDNLIAEVYVRENTKTGSRLVQTMPNGNQHFKNWKTYSQHTKPDDFVWGVLDKDNNWRQFVDFNKSFQTILKSIPFEERKDGLLYCARTGEKRVLYSLRHQYATMRLKQGTRIETLAPNMGNSVKIIMEHYNHLLTADNRSELTQITRRKTVAKPSDKADDGFVSEALERFKRGELSQAALTEILGIRKG